MLRYRLKKTLHGQLGGSDNPYEKYHVTTEELTALSNEADESTMGLAPKGANSVFRYVSVPEHPDSYGEEGDRAISDTKLYFYIASESCWKYLNLNPKIAYIECGEDLPAEYTNGGCFFLLPDHIPVWVKNTEWVNVTGAVVGEVVPIGNLPTQVGPYLDLLDLTLGIPIWKVPDYLLNATGFAISTAPSISLKDPELPKIPNDFPYSYPFFDVDTQLPIWLYQDTWYNGMGGIVDYAS